MKRHRWVILQLTLAVALFGGAAVPTLAHLPPDTSEGGQDECVSATHDQTVVGEEASDNTCGV